MQCLFDFSQTLIKMLQTMAITSTTKCSGPITDFKVLEINIITYNYCGKIRKDLLPGMTEHFESGISIHYKREWKWHSAGA